MNNSNQISDENKVLLEYAQSNIYDSQQVGFFVPDEQWLKNFKSYMFENFSKDSKEPKILELASGTGFLSKILQNEGFDVKPTDSYWYSKDWNFKTKYTEIEDLTNIEALYKYGKEMDVVILSCPFPDVHLSYQTLNLYFSLNPNGKLIFVTSLDSNENLDNVYVYDKKKLREDFKNNPKVREQFQFSSAFQTTVYPLEQYINKEAKNKKEIDLIQFKAGTYFDTTAYSPEENLDYRRRYIDILQYFPRDLHYLKTIGKDCKITSEEINKYFKDLLNTHGEISDEVFEKAVRLNMLLDELDDNCTPEGVQRNLRHIDDNVLNEIANAYQEMTY